MSKDDESGPPEGPSVIDLFREVREAMPPLFAVPDTDPDEPTRDGLGWNDLAFLAERIMLTALNRIDWADLRDHAVVVVESQEDADDIVRLMQSATIEVAVGYVE